MITEDVALAALTLAFQVWDAVGWLGQVFFTARVLIQWLASERACCSGSRSNRAACSSAAREP